MVYLYHILTLQTATTLAFCIYFLATSPEAQTALHSEVKSLDPDSQPLQGLTVLKSILKETYRLRPSAVAVGRILRNDIVLGGYQIPANVML